MTSRRELIEAIAGRYQAAGRIEKKKILDEFIKVTGALGGKSLKDVFEVAIRIVPVELC